MNKNTDKVTLRIKVKDRDKAKNDKDNRNARGGDGAKERSMKDTGSIVVGTPDVDPRLPSHVPGVHEGNQPQKTRTTSGVKAEDIDDAANARRSTGINPDDRAPKLPGMPRLTPA